MTARIGPGFETSQRERAAALYWEAFGAKLGRVLGPGARGRAFFADILDPAFAIGAVQDSRLVGLAGFKTAEGALTGGGFGDLRRHYGAFGALWRAGALSLLEREVEPDVLLMDGICVAPEARGSGLGTRLLAAIRDAARARGLARVRLDVIDRNPRARALYERVGFEATGSETLGPLRALFGFDTATRMELRLDRHAPA